MRGIGSRVGLAALAVLAVLAVGGALAPAALAKGYTIPNVSIDARVMTNGDLVVTEKRTLSFDGSFTRVYWYLDTKGSQGIEVTGVSGPDGPLTQTTPALAPSRPPGTYLVTPQGTQVFVQAFFRLSDTQATFTLQYRALGAAKRWQDTAELYWQFIGSGWDVPPGMST